ncbi:MAG TPA: esterase [Glutamicibacter sp.]|nr:esterase [Glutamicibacter sp.]
MLNIKAEGTLNHNLGIEITGITNAALQGRMPVDERTVQPAGVLHGGASVAFAETLASWAGYLVVDSSRFHVVGQEINANHLRPVIAGQYVHGEATPIQLGRRSHVWQIDIRNEAGKLACISRCTLAVIDVPGQYATKEERA